MRTRTTLILVSSAAILGGIISGLSTAQTSVITVYAGRSEPLASPQRSPAAITAITECAPGAVLRPAAGTERARWAVADALRRQPASTHRAPRSRAMNDRAEPFGDGNTIRLSGAIVNRSVGDSEGPPSSRRPAATAPRSAA